eukprot:scaffold34606_cov192-Amphora_coffeaeformis.AAC.12
MSLNTMAPDICQQLQRYGSRSASTRVQPVDYSYWPWPIGSSARTIRWTGMTVVDSPKQPSPTVRLDTVEGKNYSN